MENTLFETPSDEFTMLLQKQTYVFNRARFNVTVDPMRVGSERPWHVLLLSF
jgi:hypothetical protein